MRKLRIVLFFLVLYVQCIAQVPEKVEKKEEQINSTTEQQLENITNSNEDAETEDDSYLQQMFIYQKNPINLNYASENELKELRILTPFQIANVISYRNYLGIFINIYELQAIPGWDIETIQKIRPYISVNKKADFVSSIGQRLKGGDHTILVRATQILEKSKGFKIDPAAGKNYYQGSQQRVFMRYRYQYKNILQYGIVGEKDAGEQFFKAIKNKVSIFIPHTFLQEILVSLSHLLLVIIP